MAGRRWIGNRRPFVLGYARGTAITYPLGAVVMAALGLWWLAALAVVGAVISFAIYRMELG